MDKPIIITYYAGVDKDMFPWGDMEEVPYALRFYVVQRVLDAGCHVTLTNHDTNIQAMIFKR